MMAKRAALNFLMCIAAFLSLPAYATPADLTDDEVNAVCEAVARKNPTVEILDVQKDDLIDANNDGVLDKVGTNCTGIAYMCDASVPERPNYETQWPSRESFLRFSGRTYIASYYDKNIPHYLTYVNSKNHTRIICSFTNDFEATLKSTSSETTEICARIATDQARKHAFNEDWEDLENIIGGDKLSKVFPEIPSSEIGPNAKVTFDYNNDSQPDYLVVVGYSTGAGRGCDNTRLVRLTEGWQAIDKSEAARLLAVNPPISCRENTIALLSDGAKNYVEYRSDDLGRIIIGQYVWKVMEYSGDRQKVVCDTEIKIETHVCSQGSELSPIDERYEDKRCLTNKEN